MTVSAIRMTGEQPRRSAASWLAGHVIIAAIIAVFIVPITEKNCSSISSID